LFNDSKGKQFWNNGDRYEGEYKNGIMHGKGKQTSYLLYDLLILTLFNDSKGKKFWNNGDRYEGEYKNGIMHGKGKKEVIYLSYHCLIIL